MRNWISVSILLFSSIVVQAKESAYVIKDAINFENVWSAEQPLSAERLQSNYLLPGTLGITIFTPQRIIDSQNMFKAIQANKSLYQKAVDMCLPTALEMTIEANSMLEKVRLFLQQESTAPAFILFGAANSGGTASHEGLALGLEVLCYFAEDEEEFKHILLSFIAHEIVHVYQSRNKLYAADTKELDTSVLQLALVEGFADFVANQLLGSVPKSELERHQYGIENEVQLWQQFKQDLNSKNLTKWFYSDPGNGQPNDMGYWIGKRIAERYFHSAKDKRAALDYLLVLDDPHRILTESGYSPN